MVSIQLSNNSIFITGNKEVINPPARQLFQPLKQVESADDKRMQLVNSLYRSAPMTCAFQYLSLNAQPSYAPDDDINVAMEQKVISVPVTPLSLPAMVSAGIQTVTETFTDEQKTALEECTRGQSDTEAWIEQRKGGITGSVAHDVLTKYKTLTTANNRSKDVTHLVRCIMGEMPLNENIPALKYGRMTETIALRAYESDMIKNGHTNVKISLAGLFVDKNKIYIGASPDALVECDCCGKGLVEIKCPLSVAHENPANVKLAYVKEDSQGLIVNPNHAHYTQMISQMAVTNRSWCDLFVYTHHGHLRIRQEFDESRWNAVVRAADHFYCRYISPALNGNVATPSSEMVTPLNTVATPTIGVLRQHQVWATPMSGMPTVPSNVETPVSRNATTAGFMRKKNKRVKIQHKGPIYCCGLCRPVCKEVDDIDMDTDNSVCCDHCDMWFHWGCTGYSYTEGDSWYCTTCT